MLVIGVPLLHFLLLKVISSFGVRLLWVVLYFVGHIILLLISIT